MVHESLWCELLPQFWMDFTETSHNSSPSSIVVHDIFFLSLTSGIAELWALGLTQNGFKRKILIQIGTWEFVMRTTSTFFMRLGWNLEYVITMKCRCARHNFHVHLSRRCRVMCPCTLSFLCTMVCYIHKSLWSKLLQHFLCDWVETWNMSSPSIVDVQDTIFMSVCPGVAELYALELRHFMHYSVKAVVGVFWSCLVIALVISNQNTGIIYITKGIFAALNTPLCLLLQTHFC